MSSQRWFTYLNFELYTLQLLFFLTREHEINVGYNEVFHEHKIYFINCGIKGAKKVSKPEYVHNVVEVCDSQIIKLNFVYLICTNT